MAAYSENSIRIRRKSRVFFMFFGVFFHFSSQIFSRAPLQPKIAVRRGGRRAFAVRESEAWPSAPRDGGWGAVRAPVDRMAGESGKRDFFL
jgi:hypothetical protein